MIKQYVDAIYDNLEKLIELSDGENTNKELMYISHKLGNVLSCLEIELNNKKGRMQ